MTPEQLTNITLRMLDLGIVERFDAGLMGEEIRRLWAERDARLLVGQPVSEKRMGEIRAYDAALTNPIMVPHVHLREILQHVAFLERLLADADDLPQVRRTGYADGWKAAMSKAKVMAMEVAWPEDVKAMERYLEELAERGPD